MQVPKLWDNELEAINGNVWFRTTVVLPETAAGNKPGSLFPPWTMPMSPISTDNGSD